MQSNNMMAFCVPSIHQLLRIDGIQFCLRKRYEFVHRSITLMTQLTWERVEDLVHLGV